MLKTRIREHQMPSSYSNINLHILECETYKSEARFFKNRFKILGKGFRHKKDREKNEVFFIRTQKPSLNDQFDHKAFKLFRPKIALTMHF